jgi:hypothetical protein
MWLWPLWWLGRMPKFRAKSEERARGCEDREPRAPAGHDPYTAVLYFIDDPQYWHERADQTRKLANGLRTTEAKTGMLRIAAHYDRLAWRAEQQPRGGRR